MRRREFIGFMGGSAVAWPFAAHAQQPGGMKRVAILNGNPEIAATRAFVAAFQKGLGDLGWREGSNVSFEVRWGAADAARIDAYAAELVKLKPDVILATNTPTARSPHMAPTSPNCFAKPRLMLIVSFAARRRAIYRCRNRPGTS
jgi:putative tryptophan/tyrosine transport system substrate-binding protein